MICNCTPHAISIVRQDGTVLTLAPAGICPRVTTTRTVVGSVDGIAVHRTVLGAVVDLPDEEEFRILVVSAIVAQAAGGRGDLLSPGELIRGADGQPTGCQGLTAWGRS